MANVYKVTFEIIKGVFFFHPFCVVEAHDIDHAKERAVQVMNSHPDNVKIKKEIVDVQEVDKDEHSNYITIDEVMPYQPENDTKENEG